LSLIYRDFHPISHKIAFFCLPFRFKHIKVKWWKLYEHSFGWELWLVLGIKAPGGARFKHWANAISRKTTIEEKEVLICLKTECPVAWVVTRDEVFEVISKCDYKLIFITGIQFQVNEIFLQNIDKTDIFTYFHIYDCLYDSVLRLFLRLHAIKKGGQVCNAN
jgi:hypothetical protein